MSCVSAIQRQSKQSRPSERDANVVASVRRILELPDDKLDYAEAKIAFDSLIDPNFDRDAVLAELDCLANEARTLARGDDRPGVRLSAIRQVIYESGPWNDNRPFRYDTDDPLGRLLCNKLLHNYLRTRLGQCVSMPILFLILAKRIGLDVALAYAPEHVFVRYTDEAGRTHNLETTSGAHPARIQWFRENFPITERSIANGIYLRSLSVREGIALMASTVVEHAFAQRRFEEAVALCNLILEHSPMDVQMIVSLGSAYGHLLERFRRDHPDPWTLTLVQRAHLTGLVDRNMTLFGTAERLGWIPFE